MIFSIANQKGGVGKTTTAFALASGLASRGKRVLLVDLDPQCNLSFSTKADVSMANICDVLLGQVNIGKAIQQIKKYNNLYFIAAGQRLAGLDAQLASEMGKEYKLKEALVSAKNMCDYLIIDTPPNLGILTINALVASDSIIVTSLADIFSLQGVSQLYSTIEATRKYCNSSLKIEGILLTKFSSQTILSREIAEQSKGVAAKMGTKVFKTVIRDRVVLREAQAKQQDIFTYDPNSGAAQDYSNFIDEVQSNVE